MKLFYSCVCAHKIEMNGTEEEDEGKREVGNRRKTVTARQRSVAFFCSCCKQKLASTIHFTFFVLEFRQPQQQQTIDFIAFSVLRWPIAIRRSAQKSMTTHYSTSSPLINVFTASTVAGSSARKSI